MLLDQSPWENIHQDFALFRCVQSAPSRAALLLLHGPMTTHRTWDMLASYFCAKGFADLYAVDIQSVLISNPLHRQAVDYLEGVVQEILRRHDPQTPLVMIGHSTGGVLARRFLYKSPLAARVQYLFLLASPHHQTRFSQNIYFPPEESFELGEQSAADARLLPPTAHFHKTFVVNIYGNALGPDFDGTIRGTALPEAVNVVLPLRHGQFKQHESVFSEILAYLRGERYRLQLYLEQLMMRTDSQEQWVGPFCFEINRMRTPSTGYFKTEQGVRYRFDDQQTPLISLPFTAADSFVSVIVRLRDLNRRRSLRHLLFVKLLISLGDAKTALYELQDNQGSEIALRAWVHQMPRVLS